jgi:hypothetical protein
MRGSYLLTLIWLIDLPNAEVSRHKLKLARKGPKPPGLLRT